MLGFSALVRLSFSVFAVDRVAVLVGLPEGELSAQRQKAMEVRGSVRRRVSKMGFFGISSPIVWDREV